jgi:hypothetical protein
MINTYLIKNCKLISELDSITGEELYRRNDNGMLISIIRSNHLIIASISTRSINYRKFSNHSNNWVDIEPSQLDKFFDVIEWTKTEESEKTWENRIAEHSLYNWNQIKVKGIEKVLNKYDFYEGEETLLTKKYIHQNGGEINFRTNVIDDSLECIEVPLSSDITKFEKTFRDHILWDQLIGDWKLKYEYLFSSDPNYTINSYDSMLELESAIVNNKSLLQPLSELLNHIPEKYNGLLREYLEKQQVIHKFIV